MVAATHNATTVDNVAVANDVAAANDAAAADGVAATDGFVVAVAATVVVWVHQCWMRACTNP